MSSRSKAVVSLPVPEQLTASYSPRVTQAPEMQGQKLVSDPHTAQGGGRVVRMWVRQVQSPRPQVTMLHCVCGHPPCILASSSDLCSHLQLGFFSEWVNFQIRSTNSRDGNVL